MKANDYEGRRNISGERVRMKRLSMRLSQAALAAKVQTEGVVLEQDAISRIENGKRLITDYELKYFTDVLNIPICGLFEQDFCCAAKRRWPTFLPMCTIATKRRRRSSSGVCRSSTSTPIWS